MIPVYIPTFNNPTYTRHIVNQLKKLEITNLNVIDNNSTYVPMITLLEDLEKSVNIIRLKENKGPHYVLRDKNFYEKLPSVFCLSDPDIEFSKSIPKNFVKDLLEISEKYKMGKVGLALEIPELNEFVKPYMYLEGKLWNMVEWEKLHWQNKIGEHSDSSDIYRTNMDTTFAIYNKKYFNPEDRYPALMIAGNFTSKHLGSYKKTIIPIEEQEFYERTTRYSYTAGKLNNKGVPVFEITVHEYTLIKEELDSLRFNYNTLSQINSNLNIELQNLYNSRTWRYTIPLRNIKVIIKKLFHFLNKFK